MPPALSDYDSKSELSDPEASGGEIFKGLTPPTPQESSDKGPKSSKSAPKRSPSKTKVTLRETAATREASKSRKRPFALLRGVDLDNIITISDEDGETLPPKDKPPTFSVPTSSYRTRAQIHGSQKSELCYDQKYHPMDEYTQPKRAAMLRSKYGEQSPSDDESITSDFDENQTGSDLEESSARAAKRRKMSVPCLSRGIRRSTRRVKKDVLYKTNVHPQDSDLKRMLESSQGQESSHEVHTLSSDSLATEADGEETDLEEQNTDNEQDKANADGANLMVRTIPDTDDSGSERSPSTSTEPFPLSFVGQGRSPVNDVRRQDSKMNLMGPFGGYERFYPRERRMSSSGQPMSIYTETLQTQLYAEAYAAPSLNFEDDDKENNVGNLDLDPTPDPHEGIHVHSVTENRSHGRDDEEEAELANQGLNRLIGSFHYESTSRIPDTDGVLDNEDEEVSDLRSELDSVFGKISPKDPVVDDGQCRLPSPQSECNSELGISSSAQIGTQFPSSGQYGSFGRQHTCTKDAQDGFTDENNDQDGIEAVRISGSMGSVGRG